jgi:hypothetical protein
MNKKNPKPLDFGFFIALPTNSAMETRRALAITARHIADLRAFFAANIARHFQSRKRWFVM